LFEPLIREAQPYAKKIVHPVEPSLLRPKSADSKPRHAETNGTVLIHGSWGCFESLLQLFLRLMIEFLVPALGLTGLLAKAHTRGGQYQFERACPLAAFSEIVQDPIRRIGEEEGCNRGGQAFKHGPRSQFELLRVFPAKISAPF
jgi:hypothetical protein